MNKKERITALGIGVAGGLTSGIIIFTSFKDQLT